MVLIDSSVWIQFYNQKEQSTPELDAVLALGQAATTDLIMTEVLQGFRLTDTRRYGNALADLQSCIHVPTFDSSTAVKAANNFRRLRAREITPRNTIDVYLATLCIERQVSLLTYDLGDFVPMTKILDLKLFHLS